MSGELIMVLICLFFPPLRPSFPLSSSEKQLSFQWHILHVVGEVEQEANMNAFRGESHCVCVSVLLGGGDQRDDLQVQITD